ncbi:MAG: NUDIX hydrolase [Candidatus Angelobacter sp.]
MRREHPDRPIVGVGAVIVKDRHVLLVRRGMPPHQGRWSLPGGAVELGETLRAAAIREALEETGLLVEPGEMLEVVDRIVPGPDGQTQYHYVLIDFCCCVTGGELRAGDDAAEVVWASESELDSYALEGAVLHVISKGLSR